MATKKITRTVKNKPEKLQKAFVDSINPYIPEMGKPIYPSSNRGDDVSMRGEVFNDLTVGMEDINDAVMYYFKEIIKPYVIEDGSKVNVPVYYANPERWKASQADGKYRDKEGKVIFPVILLNRTNMEKIRTIGNKLDGNTVHNYAIFEKRFSTKNYYDNFCVLNNRVPVKEYLKVAIPDYYKIRYACSIFVNYVQDLDRIIEAVGQYSYSYWGKDGKFKFMAAIDSFDSRTEISQGSDRITICNFDIILNGYLTPKDINKQLATNNKVLSKAQVIFTAEIQDIEKNNNMAICQKRKQASFNIFPEKVIVQTTGGGGGSFDPNIIAYLNTNIARISVQNTAPDTAYFINVNILQPPINSGLPITTVRDFTFFINGQFVPNSLVTLSEGTNNTVTAIFNTTLLGYTIAPDDEVVAIGKFVVTGDRAFDNGFSLGFQ